MNLIAMFTALALSAPVAATGLDAGDVTRVAKLGSFVKDQVDDGVRGRELSEAVRDYKQTLRAERRATKAERKQAKRGERGERGKADMKHGKRGEHGKADMKHGKRGEHGKADMKHGKRGEHGKADMKHSKAKTKRR